jgi:hypothetical protein
VYRESKCPIVEYNNSSLPIFMQEMRYRLIAKEAPVVSKTVIASLIYPGSKNNILAGPSYS